MAAVKYWTYLRKCSAQSDFWMTLVKKIKMEKSHLKIPNELYVIETLKQLQYCSEEQVCFHCRIVPQALHIALICSTTLNFDQMHFKHQQPQVQPDSLATVGTIQQTQPTCFEYIDRHNSQLDQRSYWDSMETRWKTLALSTRNFIKWIKL